MEGIEAPEVPATQGSRHSVRELQQTQTSAIAAERSESVHGLNSGFAFIN